MAGFDKAGKKEVDMALAKDKEDQWIMYDLRSLRKS